MQLKNDEILDLKLQVKSMRLHEDLYAGNIADMKQEIEALRKRNEALEQKNDSLSTDLMAKFKILDNIQATINRIDQSSNKQTGEKDEPWTVVIETANEMTKTGMEQKVESPVEETLRLELEAMKVTEIFLTNNEFY